MMKRCVHFICLALLTLMPSLLLAQKELKKYDRVMYADISYTKLGFGEINQQLITQKRADKLSRRIEQIRTDYGAVIIFVSLIAEEVTDWENGNLQGLPMHYLGEDPRAARNHVTILFSEADGKNWIQYGPDNAPYFAAHTEKIEQLFASAYRRPNAYRAIRRVLKRIDHMYVQLDSERKNRLLHPQLSTNELMDLSRAEMDIAGDYDTATEHLKNALKQDAANAEARKLLGYACLELQDWDTASAAFAAAWSLSADFETAVGLLTLHYLQNASPEVKKWTEQVRQFSPDFKGKIYEAAHYENKGYFLGNTAQKVFHEVFQQEIQASNSEKMPEAGIY